MTMRLVDLGRMAYGPAWERQLAAAEGVMAGGEDVLILVEHEPVLTLGANFHEQNLLLDRAEYARRGVEVVRTDRGGDVTYHGPGQLVVYPVFDVSRHGRDLHRWMRDLEETMILTAASFGVEARRFPPHTGAWVGDAKLAAIGVKVRRWVSIHGIALNCDNDLEVFDWIVPCGIQGYGVTSLSRESRRAVGVDRAKGPVVDAFRRVFGHA